MPKEEETDPQKDAMTGPFEGDAQEGLMPEATAGADTETETVETEETTTEEPTDTETETEDSKEDVLAKYGLERYGTVDGALAGVQEKDRYIDELKQGSVQMRQVLDSYTQPRPEKRERLDFDATDDPDAAMQRAGYVRADQLQPSFARVDQRQAQTEARLDRMMLAQTVSQYTELKDVALVLQSGREPELGTNKLWDAMNLAFKSVPGLQNVDNAQLIPILFDVAQKRLGTPPAVETVTEEKKQRASTTSTGRGKTRISSETPDFTKMTEKEIFDWHEKRGLIDG